VYDLVERIVEAVVHDADEHLLKITQLHDIPGAVYKKELTIP
jgi:hypothetical protein